MQNVGQETAPDNKKLDKVNAHEIGKSSTPQSSNSSPTKSDTDPFSEINPRFLSYSSESDEEESSEVESFVIDQVGDLEDQERSLQSSKFLLSQEDADPTVDPETQARLEALLEAAGIGKLATGDGKQLADPEVLRRLTSSVSCALDEAAAALTRMRSENNPRPQPERSLVEACTDGDVGTVKKLLTEGRSVHETTEEGESLLSLACSAGYYELAQVLLAMHANVEDRGIKGDCTPLMEAASSGYVDIVRLLIHHGADVNAQSSSGNTPLMYACAGGHVEAVKVLLDAGANVEDHNENGHTPLMEAASAGHVSVAQILLEHGAGINTHSNEFKESALTLACYKGHLDMVRFLLEAGADQEHKTDEMHTALMEASMDGHVEVARLLLDSGAQVNMPTDSFESPLTLAACGGHVDLALLLIERGANIEEVNDEGYTPLMEAAREGHEDMVAVLLVKGANINAQTEETQETALTLACCGGFLEVANFLIRNGAEIELGASTPLMEAAQEGHLELVRYLLEANANVNAQTQTGDTALTYACENGHTDVARLLLQYGADLEHESEGGRTPLMKACRAGHLCTVKFLIENKANVNKQTTNNDHTPLSLAAAGGHIAVVELLLANNANPFHKLKDNSTMLIEAAKGGHTNVVQLLLDYPHSIMMRQQQEQQQQQGGAIGQQAPAPPSAPSQPPALPPPAIAPPTFHPDQTEGGRPLPPPLLVQPPPELVQPKPPPPSLASPAAGNRGNEVTNGKALPAGQNQKSLLRKTRSTNVDPNTLTTPEVQQVRNEPGEGGEKEIRREKVNPMAFPKSPHLDLKILDPQFIQRQQIVEELQRVEEELNQKGNGVLESGPLSPSPMPSLIPSIAPTTPPGPPPSSSLSQHGLVCPGGNVFSVSPSQQQQQQQGLLIAQQPPPQLHQPITTPADVVQATAISDRPKAKPTWKKEGNKNVRKQVLNFQAMPPSSQTAGQSSGGFVDQLQSQVKQLSLKPAEGVSGASGGGEGPLYRPLSTDAWVKAAAAAGAVLPHEPPVLHLHSDAPSVRPSQEVDGGQCDLLQRRCSILADDETLFDLTRPGKLNPEALESLESFSLDDVAPLVSTDKERLRYSSSYLSGVDMATKLMSSGGVSGAGGGSTFQVMGEQGVVHVMPTEQGTLQYLCAAAAANTSAHAATPTSQIPQLAPGTYTYPGGQFTSGGVTELQTQQPDKPRPPAQYHQSQHLLKAPPPCKLQSKPDTLPPSSRMKSGDSTGGTQVAQGTQTSPGVDSSASGSVAAAGGVAKKAVATAAAGKGKKARYQLQQKATQAPPLHPDSSQMGYPGCEGEGTPGIAPAFCMDVDSATDSNNDTALTLACAGGHEELVQLLLSRGANIEHRDKKGFTPLILAATAGHEKVVEILMNHSADMEAQSERTKDTPLSLACSGGRYEVVELLLSKGANKEHRNVSDYTPLSLAASGGYVNIIKLLLTHGAEINSRTGSKLGISPLMLAAMNGHTAAVKLLLDMGSDINAQIETNRNTALTLACFQGRHEVVSLLLDRRANVEHRAKTGLTPLMEAASGGYVEVGRVLLDKGADVNAPPVPSSRDTALTIAADKGHCRFVELLLNRSAQVEVKNKKGNSPLWLAANGGHLAVVELLYSAGADIDSQDNRKVSCLMAAFRKGHVKVVKWMVNHVMQFPSDQEMTRYISTVNDKELLEKCQECTKIIRAAKDQQAAKANKNATILLEELYMEKTREESKRAAAARRRERKKKKKMEKKEEKRKLQEENQKNERYAAPEEEDEEPDEDEEKPELKVKRSEMLESPVRAGAGGEGEEGDSGIDANSQGSCSSNEVKAPGSRRKVKKNKKVTSQQQQQPQQPAVQPPPPVQQPLSSISVLPSTSTKPENERRIGVTSSVGSKTTITTSGGVVKSETVVTKVEKRDEKATRGKGKGGNIAPSAPSVSSSAVTIQPPPVATITVTSSTISSSHIFEPSRHPADREDFEATGSDSYLPVKGKKVPPYMSYCEDMMGPAKAAGVSSSSPKQGGKRDEGWKEVVRKYLNSPFRSKKVSVPLNAISRVIGRGGSNINAIRTATGAHIEVEKQSKGQGERIITLKGSPEATKQAHSLIAALIKDPDVDILQILPKSAKSAAAVWEKSVNTAKSKPNTKTSQPTPVPSTVGTKITTSSGGGKRQVPSITKTTMSYTGAIMTLTGGRSGAGGGSGTTSGPATLNTSSSGVKPLQVQPQPQPAQQSAITSQTFAAKLTEQPSQVSTVQPLQQTLRDVGQSNGSQAMPRTSTPQPQSTGQSQQTGGAPQTPGGPEGQLKSPTPPASSAPAPVPSPPTPVPPPPPVVSRPPPEPCLTTQLPQPSHLQQPPPSAAQRQVSPAPPTCQPPVCQPHSVPQSLASSSVITSTVTTPATLEYSLFNDTFTKVAQQSMWGPRENDSQKGINFAAVAATGAPCSSASQLPPQTNKYLDPSPPQVDAAKAPGYRGNVVCSPVSKAVSSSNSSMGSSVTMSTSAVGGPVSSSGNNGPVGGYFQAPPPIATSLPPPPDLRQQSLYAAPTSQDLDYHPVAAVSASSRLNPRAPDFPPQPIKPPIYTPYLGQVLPPNAQTNMSFGASNKFAGSRSGGQQQQTGGGPSVARWPFAAPPPVQQGPQQQQYQPELDPNSSPSSPQHEDRKMPRPIGMERSWKNFQPAGSGPDMTDMSPGWMMEAAVAAGKLPAWNGIMAPGVGGGLGGHGGLERAAQAAAAAQAHHMFRPSPGAGFSVSRIPIHDDLSHIIDQPPFQSGLDGGQYNNGPLLQHLPVLTHNIYGSSVPDLHEPPWGELPRIPPIVQDLHSDKTHGGWAAKWSH